MHCRNKAQITKMRQIKCIFRTTKIKQCYPPIPSFRRASLIPAPQASIPPGCALTVSANCLSSSLIFVTQLSYGVMAWSCLFLFFLRRGEEEAFRWCYNLSIKIPIVAVTIPSRNKVSLGEE